MFLLLVGKLINFVKNNEENILQNKINYDLKSIILFKLDNNKIEDKLNSYILNYIKRRQDYTYNFYKNNNYNYDEKKVIFKNCSNLVFTNNINTSFLTNSDYIINQNSSKREIKEEDLSDLLTEVRENNNYFINRNLDFYRNINSMPQPVADSTSRNAEEQPLEL